MLKKQNVSQLSSQDKARLLAQWLEEKKAVDLYALDVSQICTVADVMVVATAANARHAQALADYLLDRCGEEGISFLGMDGYKTGQWVLVDLNDVLVHIFLPDARTFYNIEGLWSEGLEISLPPQPQA